TGSRDGDANGWGHGDGLRRRGQFSATSIDWHESASEGRSRYRRATSFDDRPLGQSVWVGRGAGGRAAVGGIGRRPVAQLHPGGSGATRRGVFRRPGIPRSWLWMSRVEAAVDWTAREPPGTEKSELRLDRTLVIPVTAEYSSRRWPGLAIFAPRAAIPSTSG